MKSVFSSSELAHVWAHRNAPHGRCSASMSFNGDLFSSYSTGIARLVVHKGKTAVVLNGRGFSISTSRHQSRVRQAVSHLPTFRFEDGYGTDLRPTPAQLFDYAVEQSASCADLATRARRPDKREYLATRAGEWLEEARKVAQFFGLRRKVDSKTVARLNAQKATAARKATKAEAARQLQREEAARVEAEAAREALEVWKSGADEIEGKRLTAYAFRNLPVAFRREGDELVSTYGVRVPLDDARRAFRFALARRTKGWHRNGETCPVGGYQLDAVNEQGVVAGCHRIAWGEIERLTPLLSSELVAA